MMENKLKDIKRAYMEGKIDKKTYIKNIHEIHKMLFDYCDFIKNTNIKTIHIDDEKVTMITKKDNIKLLGDRDDQRSIPIEILNFGEYEEEQINMIKKFINDDSVIFDIGANIGYHSISLSKFNNKCKIYSFEPIIKTYKYLENNIKNNELKNIKTFNIAFSNNDGEQTFYYYPEGSVNASAAILNDDIEVEKILCKIEKIDTFVKNHDIKIDLIKCDTEGSELLVFKGANETLEKFKPIIFTEMLRKWSKKFEYHPNDIIKYLGKFGYECFTIRGNNLEKFTMMDEQTIDTNFVFLNSIKHMEFINKLAK